MTIHWQIQGAAGKPILVSSDRGSCAPLASVVLAHGFKGYKDYGFLPVMGKTLMARLPVQVHRFNFSHSGMGTDISTFEHPELFEQNTLNHEVHDLNQMVAAVRQRDGDLPLVVMGHSRGGVSTLLACGREDSALNPDAVVTLASPDRSFRLRDKDKQTLLAEGYVDSPSSRTGQRLRLGKAWLEEQLSNPEAHNVLACAARIKCPVLVVHGDADATVPVACARALEHQITNSQLCLIPTGDHVFNTPNPAGVAPISNELEQALSAVTEFLSQLLPS